MGYRDDITGRVFGRLTAVRFSHSDSRGKSYWECKCACGGNTTVHQGYLKTGHTRSCGCIKSEMYERNTLPLGVSAMNDRYASYRTQAKRRGLDFLLTREEFRELVESNCSYCGSPPSNISKNRYGKGDYVCGGIDRVDSLIGYTVENCTPCCGKCNEAKNSLSLEEFVEWIRRVYRFMGLEEEEASG